MRRAFVINLLLALCWTALTGRLSAANLVVGFVVGFAITLIVRPLLSPESYGRRLWYFAELTFWFVRNLIGSSLRVARDSFRFRHRMRSGVIAISLDVRTDVEISALANLISLMPGTLTLDLSEDRKTLFIHVMDIAEEDVEAHEAEIKRELESRVMRVFGPG